MDEIKTNFDKIMDQFTESITHSVPKKISFDYIGDSFETSLSKKRKLSGDKNDSMPSKILDNSIGLNSSRESLNNNNNSLLSSPWESRRMKADLIEAKSMITKLKSEIEQQHKIQSEIQIFNNSKVTELKKQCEFSSNKVIDVEKHLVVLRKRENAVKTELIKVKNQLAQQNQTYEDNIYSLQKTNKEIEENSRILQNSLTNELNDYKRHNEKLQMEYDLTIEELSSIRAQQEDLLDKANAFDELSADFEEQKQEFEATKSKIKELEYQITSFGEWKEMAKTSTSRLSTLPDLEREIARLQKENRNLRENVGNKLLLEEEVFDLKNRLERNENKSHETATLKMQLANLQNEVENWQSIGKDHCLPNTPINPATLRSRIEQILQKDLILTSEKGNSKSEKDTYQSQIHELKTQNDFYTKANNDLKIALKHRETFVMRYKKKLVMVSKERDCYKQLVENFEKDLTISGALVDQLNPDSQLRSRLDVLERTLTGYKEMCTNLEKELECVSQFPELPMIDSAQSENYDRLKKEIENLRIENDRLKRRKEELELEMEHRCLKGDFNIDKYKVVHLTNNPAAEAYENSKNEIEKLQAEIQRLKHRNRKLEEEHDEITTRMNDTTNFTINVKEVNNLRSKLESMESKMQHMKEVYRSASLEFREVCNMLFGYRVDRIGNTNYRISSMYAENEDEFLEFRLNESGIIDMLETDYSVSLDEMVQTHLAVHKSLPAFLSSLTLELFNRTTIMV